MGNKRLTAKAMQGDKQAVHPGSRKAGQLDRVQLRALKLQKATSKRKGQTKSKFSRPIFFHEQITSPEPLTLPELRAVITDKYLARTDDELARLQAERRAGRPKSKELVELEEQRRREAAEWGTGFEVIDLTHPGTVRLLWRWTQEGTVVQQSNLHLLRMVRLTKDAPEEVTLVRQGMTEKMGLDGEMPDGAVDADGDVHVEEA